AACLWEQDSLRQGNLERDGGSVAAIGGFEGRVGVIARLFHETSDRNRAFFGESLELFVADRERIGPADDLDAHGRRDYVGIRSKWEAESEVGSRKSEVGSRWIRDTPSVAIPCVVRPQ